MTFNSSRFGVVRQPRHWGSFTDNTTQTNDNTINILKVNTTEAAKGITIENNDLGDPTQITVTRPGIYNLQFSLQLQNSSNDCEDVAIWLRKNGVDVPDSNTISSIAMRHSDFDGKTVPAWNFIVELDAFDYLELAWYSSYAGIVIPTLAASVSPVMPRVPSVILTMQQI